MGNGKGVAVLTKFVIFLVFAEYILATFACGVGKGSYTNKEFPPLRENQRKPQEDEESSVASGPFNHKVRFGSKEFKAKIVRYFGTNIVFRDDEGNGADRYMTKRCERALKKLAKYVRVKWHNKVKVRVIEAWDEDGEHPPRSLHYEGRAIDITTSDRDRKKYGALASLAYFKAEFDWVAYLDGHVHVSCKRDDAVEETSSCFPGRATVIASNGKTKRIDELEIGEKVLTRSSSGYLVYSRVVMFMDAKPNVVIKNYVEIQTENPRRKLQLTRRHLLIASKDGVNFETIFAEKVVVGNIVKVLSGNGTTLINSRVSGVKLQKLRGAFAPLTEEGTILVNGMLASCYAMTEDYRTAHLSFAPWRYLFELTDFPYKYQIQQGEHWYTRLLVAINRAFGVLPEVYAK